MRANQRRRPSAEAALRRGEGDRRRFIPLPPMGRMDAQRNEGRGLYPPARNAAAGEHDRVRAVEINDGHFYVTVERCGFDSEPMHDAEINLSSLRLGI